MGRGSSEDGLKHRMRKPRSRLYREALEEYAARNEPEPLTEAMNEICDEVGPLSDEFVAEASRRILKRTEW